MASCGWLETELECPTCDTVLTDLVWFTWGGVRSQNAAWGPIYRRGDTVLWFVLRSGEVPEDTVFPDKRCTNVGSPSVRSAQVFDERGVPNRCPGCARTLQGAVVEIADNVIVDARAVTAGGWPEGVHSRTVTRDGEQLDVPEMYPLRTLDSGAP